MELRKLVRVLVVGASLALAGCGGSGGGGTSPAPSVSGVVADGYLYKAKVCSDQNLNKKCDAGEPNTTTDENGAYRMEGTDLDTYPILVEVIAGTTVDQDHPGEPVSEDYILTAPAEKPEFISPLTTLIQQQLENNSSLSVDAAEQLIQNQLGVSIPLTGADANFMTNKGDAGIDENEFNQAHRVAQVVADAIADLKDDIEGSVEAANLDNVALGTIVELVVEEIMKQLESIAADCEAVDDDAFDSTVISGTVVGNSTIDSVNIAEEIEDAAQEENAVVFTDALLAGKTYHIYYPEDNEEVVLTFTASDTVEGAYNLLVVEKLNGQVLNQYTEVMTAAVQEDGTLEALFSQADENGASKSVITLHSIAANGNLLITWADYTANGEKVDADTETWHTASEPSEPAGFTDALLAGKTYSIDEPSGQKISLIFSASATVDGSYDLLMVEKDGDQVYTENMTARVQEDGTLEFFFTATDAADPVKSVNTLHSIDANGNLTISWIDYAADGTKVEEVISEIWQLVTDPQVNSLDIIGGWGFGVDGAEVYSLTFYSDGTYINWGKSYDDEGGYWETGVEYGTYSYDQDSGDLTATAIVLDQNGELGLSDTLTGANGVVCTFTVTLDGDTMTTAENCADELDTWVLNRVTDDSSAIVGSWGGETNASGDLMSLTFYPNGSYLHWNSSCDDPDAISNGPGVEYGNYSYDTASQTLVSSPIVDENGWCGISDWSTSNGIVPVDADSIYFAADDVLVQRVH